MRCTDCMEGNEAELWGACAGETPLALAAAASQIAVVSTLLAHHADVNLGKGKAQPLHRAAATGNTLLAPLDTVRIRLKLVPVQGNAHTKRTRSS